MILPSKNHDNIVKIVPFIVFLILGMPSGLLGIAWPSIQKDFNQPIEAISFILSAVTIGYMLSSLFVGSLTKMISSSLMLCLSCLLLITASLSFAFSPSWNLIIFCSFLGGMGSGTLDPIMNNYAVEKEDQKTIQWMHACFGIGIMLAPLLMTVIFIYTPLWQIGYIFVCVIQMVLFIAFLLTFKNWGTKTQSSVTIPKIIKSIISQLQSVSSMVRIFNFFLVTGMEMCIGLWMFSILTKSRGYDVKISGIILSGYWMFYTFGRIMSGHFSKILPDKKLFLINISGTIIGLLIIALNQGLYITIMGILVTAFFISPIFPALVYDVKKKVTNEQQLNQIGIQLSFAGLGRAIIPSIAAMIAQSYGLEAIPIFLLFVMFLFCCGYYYIEKTYQKI